MEIIEQLIFYVIALALFVIMFFKIIQKNDTSYVIILITETIGILLNFIFLITKNDINIMLKIFIYLISIFVPLAVIIMEKRGLLFKEIISISTAKICILFKNNKFAKKILIDLIEKYPNTYWGHKMLAEIYESEGGMRKAIDEYVQAIDINKQDYNSYYKIANLLNDLDKKDEASVMLKNLLNKKPEYIEASLLLGDILIEKEKYKEALYVLNDALKFNETNFELNYNLGIAYTMLNDFKSAKIYYEKAAMFNSLEYNSRYSLAEIALIYKELEEAEKYFVVAAEDKELEADSYFELAKIELIRGNKDKAIMYSNVAIESNPKKIVPKIKQDQAFILIITKLNIPLNLDNIEEKESKLTKKEKKAKEHLEHTFDITKNLGYTNMNKIDKPKEQDEDNKEIETSIDYKDKKIKEREEN